MQQRSLTFSYEHLTSKLSSVIHSGGQRKLLEAELHFIMCIVTMFQFNLTLILDYDQFEMFGMKQREQQWCMTYCVLVFLKICKYVYIHLYFSV